MMKDGRSVVDDAVPEFLWRDKITDNDMISKFYARFFQELVFSSSLLQFANINIQFCRPKVFNVGQFVLLSRVAHKSVES